MNYKPIETCNLKLHYFSEIKTFWSARNNQLAIDVIKKLNSRNKALSIATYDLPIFYTNIAQNKVKKCDEKANQF